MSILAAATWPSIVGVVSGNQLTNNAYELRGLIQAARSSAMTQNTYVWLGFYSYTRSGAPAVMVAAVSAKSGLVTDLQSANFQPLMKPVTLKNTTLDAAQSYLSLPGVDQADNNDAVSQSAYPFNLSVPGNATATFTSVIAFAPDGSTSLPQSTGSLKLVPRVGIGLNAAPASAQNTHTVAVQVQGLSGQVSVFQK